ncbi:MAG: serine hydrolase [Alphaproteobacteria bacterium]|nr:serine hydrolase [Alphaproteobacteria bacterium]
MHLGKFVLSVLVLAVFWTGVLGTAHAEEQLTDAQILQMLHVRVDLQKKATGMVVGIIGPQGKRIISYGTLGIGDARRVNGQTVFAVGSITKVLTALLLTDMAVHKKVNLDDAVGKYFPDTAMPSYQGRQIELADLATHTSGLPLRPANLPSSDPANPYAGYTQTDLLQFLSGYTLTRAPGSAYDYSNVGYGLLGAALASRAGESYQALVRSRITAPLGMNDTRIVPTADMSKRMASGYDIYLNPVVRWDMGALESAGSYLSTADDLLKFLSAALRYCSSPLRPAMDAMIKMRRPGGMQPATQIALAWNILGDGGHTIVWKNGSVAGFRAFVGFDPDARIGVVALANAQTGEGGDDIGLHVLTRSFPVDLHVPRTHTEIALDTAVLDQYVGSYRYSETDIVTVARKGDHLETTVSGMGTFPIFAEKEREFFYKAFDVQITFGAIVNGHATEAIWHQAGQDQTGTRFETGP